MKLVPFGSSAYVTGRQPADGKKSISPQTGKKWGWLIVRVGVSLLLLSLLFLKIEPARVTQILGGADLPLVLGCFFAYILLFLLLAYRWQVLLNVLSLNIPLRQLYGTYLIGVFFNNFLPTTIGGDMVRGLDLYRHTKKGKE
ncbi:MAG TPA: lysylphosphatidylglycerol synthase transmembrane domain-containing protein, partial [Nitrospiria bacterium]|nr:lysylphosphatidylglycerol synthase transmembrane domain-containing protein [Nitrospiria bacterium]